MKYTWRLCDGAVTWGVSTDTFPFQAIMEGSWDCEALAFFILVGWSPSSITCYLQVIFGDLIGHFGLVFNKCFVMTHLQTVVE